MLVKQTILLQKPELSDLQKQLLKKHTSVFANAVAPGFIETKMTENLPFFVKEGGRRLSTLKTRWFTGRRGGTHRVFSIAIV
jgi:NAD(P)-dependent dehydrogenase (short-subunit alcohol dehydrogenase family)